MTTMTVLQAGRAINEAHTVKVLVNVSARATRGLEITRREAGTLLRGLEPDDEVRAIIDAGGTLFIGTP